jgi:hypothetical protein
MADIGTCSVCGAQATSPRHRRCADHPFDRSQAFGRTRHSDSEQPADADPTPAAGSDSPYAEPPKKPEKPRGFAAWFGSKKPEPGSGPERRPKAPPGPRRSTAELLASGYGGIGMALTKTGADVPVGRALIAQAPVAGEILDDAIRGTAVDKLLQPIVRVQDRWEAVWALFSVPVLVGALERKPEAAPVLMPMLRSSVESYIIAMAPAVKKQQQRAERVRKTIAEAWPDMPADADPVSTIIDSFFVGVEAADEEDATVAV